MQKVTINPSIAAIVNIDSVGYEETVPIYFTAVENWTGNYEFGLWNSDKKNTETIIVASPIEILDKVMTLTIAPAEQAISVNQYYYEIFHIETARILFKGSLNIVK